MFYVFQERTRYFQAVARSHNFRSKIGARYRRSFFFFFFEVTVFFTEMISSRKHLNIY